MAIALAIAMPALLIQRGSAPAEAAASDRPFLKVWAAENENRLHERTRSQAVLDAERFDVIVATPRAYSAHVAAMRAANPYLHVNVYLNGTYAQETEGDRFPSSWYARDAAGRKIRSVGYGNYLMLPTSSGWIDQRISFCRQQLVASGYDGCMLDMLGTASVRREYVTGLPINPATGEPWTARQWQRATTALAQKVDAAVTQSVWGNGYGSGTRYYDDSWGPSSILATGVQGALTESWMRIASEPATSFKKEADWRKSLDMLVDLGAAGERTAVMVKLWGAGTTSEKDRYHRYALATFLLGSDGKSTFSVSYSKDEDRLRFHPYWKTNIGTPTQRYTVSNGVYRRTFTGGLVLVNPTTTTRTVTLDGNYVNLKGTTVSSVKLGPNTGDVLRRL